MTNTGTHPNVPVEGSCRCGAVRLTISAPPILTMACHCTGCQKMSSGAYSLSVAIPAEGFAVTAGETVIGGLHGADLHHHFCAHCMNWMFTRIPSMPHFVNVRSTMLDDPASYAPYVETFTSEKLPFAATGAARSYERFPPMEDLAELVGAYQAQA